jgi:enoyl-CoA hydratase/carnithine racemase
MHRVGEQKMNAFELRKTGATEQERRIRCQLTDGHNRRMTESVSTAPTTPRIELQDGVATLTLNRPAHRNRLEDVDLHALMRAFDRFNADPQVRVVVITANTTGQPRPVFCAGYHIGDFDGPDHDPAMFERVADALANLRAVTVCALNGSVYGGATDLALACDLRIALAGIELRMPATALGLHYYPSGLQRYVARLGISGAKRAFLTARPFSAQQLMALGALEEIAPTPEALQASVRQLTSEIGALAPLALQTTKQSLNEISSGRYELAAMRERERLTAASQDFAEGRLAFQEKRTPQFRGE